MRFTWIGGPSFVLELGPFRIVGDPVLRDRFELDGEGTVIRLTRLPALELGGADVVLVTSLRADHLDAEAVARCGADVVLLPATGAMPSPPAGAAPPPAVFQPLPGAKPLGAAAAPPKTDSVQPSAVLHSFRGAKPLARDGSARLEKGNASLVVTAVAAGSGGAGADGSPHDDRSGARTGAVGAHGRAPVDHDNGYFLRLESGARPFTVYVTGDTVFSEQTREIQRTHGYSNLLVLHVGAERSPDGTLRSAGSKEAMQIVYRMQPNAIAAVHHSTFSHYTEPVAPFVEKIGLTIYEKRLRLLREGESFEKVIGPGE